MDIQGRVTSNDWIQVIPASSDNLGWVSALPELVLVNVDFDNIPLVELPPPPTPPATATPIIPKQYSAPVLTGPDNGVGVVGEFPPLYWEWEGELKDDEFFEVRVWYEDLPYHAVVGWVKQPNFDYNISGERFGKYFWTVIIVQGENERRKDWTLQPWWPYPMWEGELVKELSPESEPRFFFFTPSGSGSNDGPPGSPISKPSCPSPPC